MKKANKQVKKGGISAMNKMKEKSSFMLVTSGVQSFNATQQKNKNNWIQLSRNWNSPGSLFFKKKLHIASFF